MKNRTVEILAPAGSYESMVAAVNAGADAGLYRRKPVRCPCLREQPG